MFGGCGSSAAATAIPAATHVGGANTLVISNAGRITDFIAPARRQNVDRVNGCYVKTTSLIQRRSAAFTYYPWINRLATAGPACAVQPGSVLRRRSHFIRFGAGWLRNRGYNTRRRVAVAGDLPAGRVAVLASAMSCGCLMRVIKILNRAASR
ncbi:hypothetical protein KCP74_14940 [Salmonella enterica subsp. enterica]|nr:hypothetical protein KCP74_14940 [Salmonella enterica subsp. enterica]